MTTAYISTHLCLSVCVSVSRQAEGGREGGRHGGWKLVGLGEGAPRGNGGARVKGGMGPCCNMLFILVLYLTVEDNRGLSVWLYEKNLNTIPKHSLMNS